MIRLLAALFALIATPAVAATSAHTAHLDITLAAESIAPRPGGTFTLALDVRARSGWHIYWQNPGEAGLPPEVKWTLPAGAVAGPLKHPIPSLLTVQGITSMVHEHDATLLVDVTLPDSIAPGTKLPIVANLQWLVCSETLCVPERATLDLNLGAGDGTPDPSHAALFANARAHQPAALDRPGSFTVKDGRIAVFVPLALPGEAHDVQLFPAQPGTLSLASPQIASRAEGGVVIEGKAGDAPAPASFAGLLRFAHADGKVTGLSFTAAPGPVPTAGAAIGGGGERSPAAFLLALGGAILGGLLLNLMPCVFPILSLKALSLAKAGESEAAARRDAIGYAAGAIAVLLALGGIILLLRGGGSQIGWAFQLQNPHIVALLILLSLGIALNLAGLFELPSLAAGGKLAARGGLAGSFFTGALAAFVATPCTGPFMAGALGAALLLPAPLALGVFAGLGLGLALPFLVIGFVPAVRNRLPRPGAWMNRLRRVLSIPMFVTALGLAWVLGQQAGVTAMTAALGLALVLGLSLWWLGLGQHAGRAPWLPLLPALAAVAAVTLLPSTKGAEATPTAGLAAERYNAATLASLRAQGRPVFVYMTADWCLSCKVNEASSLSSPAVAEAFRKAGIATLEGDWTRSDPEIEKLLAERGRAGIPLYLFYPANGGKPRELPQVLTPSMLTALAG